MPKKLSLVLAALLSGMVLLAQGPTGGVKGTVVNRADRQPVENARLILLQGTSEVASVLSAEDGTFAIPGLADGMYSLVIQAPDFMETRVEVTVNDGYVKNMFNLSLTGNQKVAELEDAATDGQDMEDSG